MRVASGVCVCACVYAVDKHLHPFPLIKTKHTVSRGTPVASLLALQTPNTLPLAVGRATLLSAKAASDNHFSAAAEQKMRFHHQ